MNSIVLLKAFKSGRHVPFGSYRQGGRSDESEPIQWRVLAVEGSKALLISCYAMECQHYDTVNTASVWQNCTLRGWLNDRFYNTAFTAEEQSRILTTAVQGTEDGEAAEDRIFLLSPDETEKYFNGSASFLTDSDNDIYMGIPDRQCSTTDYAQAQGERQGPVMLNDDTVCSWWLRSIGREPHCAAYVGETGSIVQNCCSDDWSLGVRPAMWISIS